MSREQPDSCLDDRRSFELDPDAELDRFYADVDMGYTCPFCQRGRPRPAIAIDGKQWTRCESCGAQWEIKS